MTVIPRRCIAGPQLKLYSCPTMHNYSRFRVLGTYAKQDTYFSVDFPSEIVACIGGIALKRSGHDFSFTNRSSGRCCDFAPPWSQRTGGTTISSVPICPVITENGNTVTVKIQAFLGYTPSRFSPLWRKLLLHQFRPPPHASWQSPEKYSSFPAVKNRVR